jgi:predicted RNA-binding Zn ribbon-like protein
MFMPPAPSTIVLLVPNSLTAQDLIDSAVYDVETIALLGGHLALDFANTIEDRAGPRPDDTLRTPSDLRRWGVRLAVLSETDVTDLAHDELEAALRLRERLLGLLEAMTANRAPSAGDKIALAAAVADAHAHGDLVAAADGTLAWCWDSNVLPAVRWSVANAALELLSGPDANRIRRCAGSHCGWFFLDTTKNASRRWCSMRGCGNHAKARRRRERR